MPNNSRLPQRAIVGGVEVNLVEAVPHVSGGEGVCVLALPDGSRRYVLEAEWLVGAERYRAQARSRGIVTSESPDADKIALFRSLFRGREGAYAHGYLNKHAGRIGYSPACVNERTSRCPRWNGSRRGMKCGECPCRVLVPLADDTLKRHFKGGDPSFRDVCGLYVLTEESKTWVLVADFDKSGWEREVSLYCGACAAHGLECAVERSRSGNGAHVWLFFEEAVDASLARSLGSALVTWAMERSADMGFSAYDRLFPTQDSLTEDGLGNLIALPFQGTAMRSSNSVFVDKSFAPYPDQWQFLSSVAKVSERKASGVVAESVGGPLGSLVSLRDRKSSTGQVALEYAGGEGAVVLTGADLPATVTVTRANVLHIPKEGMSARACDRVRRLAALANPEFYRAQAMRQPVYGKSRVLWCGEEDDEHILLPRGCEERLVSLVEGAGARCLFIDKRNQGAPIRAEFIGVLRESQQRAAGALLAHECGVLSAPTGFGKTVIAAYLIGTLKLRTLVLVPRAELVSQWLDSMARFLAIQDDRPPLLTKSGRPSKRVRPLIGSIGGGKTKPSGIVDIATYQSLTTKDYLGTPVAKPVVAEYDMVICDECHHGAAPNLERVVRGANSRCVYGLSATPRRRDGLEKIVFMQCGPIRYVVDPKEQVMEQGFKRLLVPRFTRVRIPGLEPGSSFNDVVDALSAHDARNRLVAADVAEAVRKGRTPLVLTRLVNNAKTLAGLLEEAGVTTFLLMGAHTTRERRERMGRLRSASDEPYAVVATGSYAGEGLDLPRLDTLMLASPYSSEGVVTQFVGRLHREDEGKTEVRVFDYVDASVPMLERMYKRRLRAYARLGYEVADVGEAEGDGATLVDGPSWLGALVEDIRSAEKKVRIAAPYAGAKAVSLLLPALRDATEHGVPVGIAVSQPAADAAQERLASVVAMLREAGCKVEVGKLDATGVSVIDGRIAWYGTLPLLAMPKDGDCSLRVVSAEVAADVDDLLRVR